VSQDTPAPLRSRLGTTCVLLLVTALAGAAQSSPFDYDATAPLDYRESKIATRNRTSIYAATFASPRGGRAECHLVAPDRAGKFAGVVWQHGGGQNWTWFLPDALALANLGAASVLMTAPWDRAKENKEPQFKDQGQQDRADYIHVAVDARRAYDLLASRPDVDKNRIGYVGLSFGAMMGGSLAGVDKRFRTFILIAGVESFARHWRESPLFVEMRQKTPKAELDELIESLAPIEAVNNIGKSTAPILFQSARFDPGVPEIHSIDFYKAAGEPKELKWYDTGHQINDPQAFSDRQDWLRKYLSIP